MLCAVGGLERQAKYEQAARNARDKLTQLEMSEKNAVRQAMTEEQGRFGFFVTCLRPVMVSASSDRRRPFISGASTQCAGHYHRSSLNGRENKHPSHYRTMLGGNSKLMKADSL